VLPKLRPKGRPGPERSQTHIEGLNGVVKRKVRASETRTANLQRSYLRRRERDSGKGDEGKKRRSTRETSDGTRARFIVDAQR
jgi:hypothetical protein